VNDKKAVDRKVSPYDPGGVGQTETRYDDGSTKYTTFNTGENTRHSHTADGDGNVSGSHSVDQSTGTKTQG